MQALMTGPQTDSGGIFSSWQDQALNVQYMDKPQLD